MLNNDENELRNLDKFITEAIVLHKDSKIWGNENECRIVLANNALSKLDKISNSDAGYIIDYPEGDVLEEVTFGVKFEDPMGREQVILFIKKHHKNVNFNQAKLDYKTMTVVREEIKIPE
ncbi:hypothetical protein OAT16_11065 [Prolixibacteraceae bacterium]|nr:hypothetical protein [Prolixibacteraceae bacterium]